MSTAFIYSFINGSHQGLTVCLHQEKKKKKKKKGGKKIGVNIFPNSLAKE
jgi:hypothetical protein